MRILMAFLAAVPAFGDELTLRDGSKVEWTALRSKGDSYEVETKEGKQVTVRKSDVAKISPSGAPEITPLTGAAFTKEKRKTVLIDLLQTVDVKRDVVAGQWKAGKGGLIATHDGANNARLQFKRQPVEDYDISLTIERKAGGGDFVVGLVGGSPERQFEVILDGASGRSGLCTAEGWKDEIATAPGAVLPLGVPRKVTILVRKTGVLVKVEDKELVVWAGDWTSLVVPPVHAVTSKDSMFFACCNGTYEVTRALIVTSKFQP